MTIMKNSTIKVSDTRFPRMTRAIIRRLDRAELAEVAQHGAGTGWNGFINYSDTLAFYKAHKADILALAKQLADDLGEDMLNMIAGFGCLKAEKLTPDEIAEALYSGRGVVTTTVRNAMAWFALEETARELNPEL